MSNTDKHYLGQEESDAVSRVIHSGKLFRYQAEDGECKKFEKEFAEKIGCQHALMVSSGTNALIAALIASGIGPGDEVIIPAYTFIATAAAVLNVSAIPVVVNIDSSIGISVKDIESKITQKTKAIIPVHMDGLSCDLTNILNIANKHGLVIIEDTCQAIGGTFREDYLGTLGDFGCFSLNVDKIITCGDGGIVITNSREKYEKLCCISDSAFSFSPHHKHFFNKITPRLGFSMRVSEISGAIMREQLKKLDKILKKFRDNKNLILNLISKHNNLSFSVINGNDPGGDCGVALHLLFDDPGQAKEGGKQLRDSNIPAIPPTLRPAHAAWKWSHMLGDNSHFNDLSNPYRKNQQKYDYSKFNYLESLDILSRVLRIEIDINWSKEYSTFIATKICELLKK